MEYVALHYVRIAGKMYTPGDVIEGEIGGLERLTRLGAVRAIGNAKSENADAFDGCAQIVSEAETQEAAPETEAEEAEDEIEEAPMSIDVSDGIVDAPKRTRRKRA